MLRHIAIIMDGNRRWAKANNLNVYEGYKKGAFIINNLIRNIMHLHVKYLTVYAFSSENWNRPLKEIAGILNIGLDWLNANLDFFLTNDIKCMIIGNKGLIPYSFLNKIEEIEEQTKFCKKLHFQIALSYGSRDEILRAILKLVCLKKDSCITEQLFEQCLDTCNIPDPDLLIRTGGEKRLSNYMLWQLAYTELRFIDTLWPDFNTESLNSIIHDYQQTQRKFGYLG